MAVWQARIHAILQPPVPGGWGNWPRLPDLRAALVLLFGEETTEADGEALHWGPYHHHDARLWLDDEDGTILVRLDLRILDRAFVRALVTLLIDAGLRLRLQDGTTIEATEDNLRRLIRESDATRFMDDPWAYSRSLPPGNSDPPADSAC